MSAIVVIPVMLPAAGAAWPILVGAAAAAASALGYSAVDGAGEVEGEEMVEIAVENAEAVSGSLAHGETLTFVQGEVRLTFARGSDGTIAVQVHAAGKSKAELKQIGETFAQRVTQQYVYNRLLEEMDKREFNLIDQEVEDDGTVRLHVRTFQQ